MKSIDNTLSNEKKTLLVVLLTAVTMVVEIVFGYWTHSMALLADGYHMSSHVLALGLSWIAYYFARRYSNTGAYHFSKDKLLALSGFTSALVLQAVAVFMGVQSIGRMLHPLEIRFSEAIIVAVIGLFVNALSAVILHHDKHVGDHNIRSAYLHVLADGLTSITAIIALLAGMYFKLYELDAISGLISSVIITKWAIGLVKSSGRTLIDFTTF